MAVETEVGLGCRVADEYRVVDRRGEHGWVEDSDDEEPCSADQDALTGSHLVDAEPLRCSGTHDRYGQLCGCRIEEVATSQAGTDAVQDVDAGGPHGQGVGVDR